MSTPEERKVWYETLLSNDEQSTDEELVAWFVEHDCPESEVREYVSRRSEYLNHTYEWLRKRT